MSDTKAWYTSKTVWAGIITAVAGVAGVACDKHLDPVDVDQIANGFSTIGEAISVCIPVVSGLIAIYGRLKATQPIGKK